MRTRSDTSLLSLFSFLTLLTACDDSAPAMDELRAPAGGKGDEISPADDPSGLLGKAERRLAKLLTEADIDERLGVPIDRVPYPDTYWPMIDNGIATQWAESDGTRCGIPNDCEDPVPSPLQKYMAITDPMATDEAVAWEQTHHGIDVPGVASWFGHCPGWTASAMLNAPILHPVFARADGKDRIAACNEGEEGCVKFEIGDINGLQAEIYNNAANRFIGSRCDTALENIAMDEFGRIIRTGAGCQGLNAGSLVIIAANRLKNDGLPFAIDAQTEFSTDQIWNQPVQSFTVHALEPVDEEEAANLVAFGSRSGRLTEYQWNDKAKGFVRIDLSIDWIGETSGPNFKVVPGDDHTESTRMVAVIELDRDPKDPEAIIIGGEYIVDESAGASRLQVPPFVWIALEAGSDRSGGHNPFVKSDVVKQLIALGTTPEG